MSEHQGQTDQPLKIKVTSSLQAARWLEAEVAANGEAGLEVQGSFIGERAPVKVAFKDKEGGSAGNVDGVMLSNLFRARWKPGAKNAGKAITFEAELSKHGLKITGGLLRVLPVVEITQLKWTLEGKETEEVSDGQAVDMEAALKGPADGTEALVSIHAHKANHGEVTLVTVPVKIKAGKVKVSWRAALPGGEETLIIQKELEKLGLKYFQPIFTFKVSCLGVTVASKPIKLISWVAFEFGPAAAGEKRTALFEMPDGKEQKETVPEDGKVKVTAAMPGRILFKGFE